MSLKVGTLAYATDQGLGFLTKDFYDNGVVTDVFLVEHAHRKTHYDWYPNAPRTSQKNFRTNEALKFCQSMDIMLFFETPFHWSLIPHCRKHNIPTILMPMHECTPRVLPYVPDAFFCPSKLDYECFKEYNSRFIPVPVNTDLFPFKQRKTATTFVHNAGHGGLKNRNGTGELIDAIHSIDKSIDFKFILRSQQKLQWDVSDERVEVQIGTLPSTELYKEGDVFVFPEKFNGLSLPLQEAFASGMIVMATDRLPNNTYLPKRPLIPVAGYEKDCVSGRMREYDCAIIKPTDIAIKILEFVDEDISELSLLGEEYAENNCWSSLKPVYDLAINIVANKDHL